MEEKNLEIIEKNKNELENSKNNSFEILKNKRFHFEYNFPDKFFEYLDINKTNYNFTENLILQFFNRQEYSENTILAYAFDIKYFKDLMEFKLNSGLEFVTEEDANQYSSILTEIGISPSLKKRRLIIMKKLFEFFENYLSNKVKGYKSPFRLIKPPKVTLDEGSTSAYNQETINKLIKAITPKINKKGDISLLNVQIANRDKALIVLHINTGTRISEILQARPNSFKEENGMVKFSYIGKGNKKSHSIITGKVFDLINKYIQTYGITENEFVFHPISRNPEYNRQDKAITAMQYGKILKKYGAKIGIPELRSHSIRASAITILSDHVKIHELASFANHKSINTTNHYIKTKSKHKKKTGEEISAKIEF